MLKIATGCSNLQRLTRQVTWFSDLQRAAAKGVYMEEDRPLNPLVFREDLARSDFSSGPWRSSTQWFGQHGTINA
jgi:hypothetical protein